MLPGNRFCADCKEPDPRWASYNLGIFLCIRCAGIHRGLGTHISKVRSVDLDTWTHEMVDSMERTGNELGNRIWEGRLAQPFRPDLTRLESFIRSKYEQQEFVLREPNLYPVPEPVGVPSYSPAMFDARIATASSYYQPDRIPLQPQSPMASFTPRPSVSLRGSLRSQPIAALHASVEPLPTGRVVTAATAHQPAIQDWNQVVRRTALMSGHIGAAPGSASSTISDSSFSSSNFPRDRSSVDSSYSDFPSNMPVDVSGGTGIPRWMQHEPGITPTPTTTYPPGPPSYTPVVAANMPSHYGYPASTSIPSLLMSPGVFSSAAPSPGNFQSTAHQSAGRIVTAVPSYSGSTMIASRPKVLP